MKRLPGARFFIEVAIGPKYQLQQLEPLYNTWPGAILKIIQLDAIAAGSQYPLHSFSLEIYNPKEFLWQIRLVREFVIYHPESSIVIHYRLYDDEGPEIMFLVGGSTARERRSVDRLITALQDGFRIKKLTDYEKAAAMIEHGADYQTAKRWYFEQNPDGDLKNFKDAMRRKGISAQT